MMNWLWVAPWIIIIIFFSGWHFGGKIATKREVTRKFREEADRREEQVCRESISDLYKHLYELESKIEQFVCTKEENGNG